MTVVSGTIRTPDDADALRVKLSIWDTEITMRVDGVELGNWEASEISIRAIDSTSFEFIAEGDQLIFTPEDSAAFATTSFVKGRTPGAGRKGRRKVKKKAEPPRPAVVDPDPPPEAESRRSKRRSADERRAPKPSRRERKAAELESTELAAAVSQPAPVAVPSPPHRTVRQEAVPTPIGRAESGAIADRNTATDEKPAIRIPAFRDPVPEPTERLEPVQLQEPEVVEPPPRVEQERAVVPDSEVGEPPQWVGARPGDLLDPEPEHAPRQKKSLLRRTAREDLPEEVPPVEPIAVEPEEQGPAQPNRMWIRALDLARKYDFLGLDRVPVNESLRGQEHQHTWDHRVAPTSGPGKYICTLCGEIRR